MKFRQPAAGLLGLAAVAVLATACKSPQISLSGPPAGAASAAATTGPGASMLPTPQAIGGTGGTVASLGQGGYVLQAMPAGSVLFAWNSQGQLLAHVTMDGLTPGSVHDLQIGSGPQAITFTPFTAGATGQADATVTATNPAAALPPHGRLVVDLGSISTGSAPSALAAEPIAETGPLPTHPYPGTGYTLHAVTAAASGQIPGHATGYATLTWNAAQQALTVTVTAYGLQPGPHAAHVHQGSCQSQGPPQYMMPDFTADQAGAIISQRRVITGVTTPPAAGATYLNLHMGGMNQILDGTTPTLLFQPLLCVNITGSATTSTPAATVTPGTPEQPAPPQPSTATPSPLPTPASTSSPSPTASPVVAGTHF